MKKALFLAVIVAVVCVGLLAIPRVRNSGPVRSAMRAVGLRGPADYPGPEAKAGWTKYEGNPVLGGSLGTCFDVSAMVKDERVWLYFSWRPRAAIALATSEDGFTFDEPSIALRPGDKGSWQEVVNRPGVIEKDGQYLMWYTGQTADMGSSAIGLATSKDGKTWTRRRDPVMKAEQAWEKGNVMCPDVLYDEKAKLFRMWYSAGDAYEPDAIGYAISEDGITWAKLPANPVMKPGDGWEKHKVTAGDVRLWRGEYVMFYIGFQDEHNAAIGMAGSDDGLEWRRHPQNPLITHGKSSGAWDADAVYKPSYIDFKGKQLLYYNGRREDVEQIGVAFRRVSE